MARFDEAVTNWLLNEGYIADKWRIRVVQKNIIKNSDNAEILIETYKPRGKKIHSYISFIYNFVKDRIYLDTLTVDIL